MFWWRDPAGPEQCLMSPSAGEWGATLYWSLVVIFYINVSNYNLFLTASSQLRWTEPESEPDLLQEGFYTNEGFDEGGTHWRPTCSDYNTNSSLLWKQTTCLISERLWSSIRFTRASIFLIFKLLKNTNICQSFGSDVTTGGREHVRAWRHEGLCLPWCLAPLLLLRSSCLLRSADLKEDRQDGEVVLSARTHGHRHTHTHRQTGEQLRDHQLISGLGLDSFPVWCSEREDRLSPDGTVTCFYSEGLIVILLFWRILTCFYVWNTQQVNTHSTATVLQ